VLVVGAAAERLITRSPQVRGVPVLIVSGVAALTMTVGALVLQADPFDDDAEDIAKRPAVARAFI
jgi:cobalt-zinc-cadmium efflux system protein